MDVQPLELHREPEVEEDERKCEKDGKRPRRREWKVKSRRA